MQRYLACTGTKAAKVEVKRIVFVAAARRLLWLKRRNSLLCGTVDKLNLHDTVVVVHAANLGDTDNACLGYECTTCLLVQWVIFPLNGYNGTSAATAASAYGKLLLVAYGVALGIYHGHLYHTFCLGIYLQVGWDEVIRAAC